MLTIYGNKISYKVGVKRILSVYERNNGRFNGQWYNDANEFCTYLSKTYGITIPQAAGIVSAFSVLKRWDINQKITEKFLSEGATSHTKQQTNKAKRILQETDISKIADILNGQKTVSFFYNMLYPNISEYVTVDRHSLSILLMSAVSNTGKESGKMTTKQYEITRLMYVMAAKKVGIPPLQLQAITWDIWRNDKSEMLK